LLLVRSAKFTPAARKLRAVNSCMRHGTRNTRAHWRGAAEMVRRDTPGIAIGGLSGGEEKTAFVTVVNQCTDLLPEGKPRYCMGVGCVRRPIPTPAVWLCARGIGWKTMCAGDWLEDYVYSMAMRTCHVFFGLCAAASRVLGVLTRQHCNLALCVCAGTRWTSWSAWPWASTCLTASSRPAPRYVVVRLLL
jgi:hypothetical protein